MRIAVAGGGGLGYLIAKALTEAPTAYNVVVLSRYNRTEYAALDVQVVPANYSDTTNLAYSLQGVNLVISVIRGGEQLNLIRAAASAGVQLFVPSEFEGKTSNRQGQDPFDEGGYAAQARSLLRRLSRETRMQYTIFSCGVFMERFHPYGFSSLGFGTSTGPHDPGSYLLDLTNATAEIVERNEEGESVRICMTSIHDVGSFIVAAIEIGPGNWPHEYTMRGERISLRDIVGTCSRTLRTPFNIQQRRVSDLASWIVHYTQQGDYATATRYQQLLATANGRYDFRSASLNSAIRESQHVEDIHPTTFHQWLESIYSPQAT